TLVAAVNAADPAVAQTLGAPGSLTVFAPTNAAFEDLFATLGVTPEQVLADTALVTDILLYHVAQPASFSGELARLDGRAITTLLSDNALAVSSPGPGSIRLNNRVNVVQADITASNGVVYVIDRVLLPNRVFLGVGTNTSQPPPQPAATRTPVPAAPSTAGRGALGVAHLAPTAPAVDVYVNGEVAVPGLTFGNITDFIPLAPGSYDVAIAPAGTSLQDAVFGSATVNVGNGQFLTAAAVGSLDAGTFNVFVFPND
ncbi:MAG: fasciclin domain-containing protein, partial [Chloroflexota bacterium]